MIVTGFSLITEKLHEKWMHFGWIGHVDKDRKRLYHASRAFLCDKFVLAFTKSFASLVFRVVGLFNVPATPNNRAANDFMHAKTKCQNETQGRAIMDPFVKYWKVCVQVSKATLPKVMGILTRRRSAYYMGILLLFLLVLFIFFRVRVENEDPPELLVPQEQRCFVIPYFGVFNGATFLFSIVSKA